jgi:hypothetical protein
MKKKPSNFTQTYHGCDFLVWRHGQEFYRAATVLKEANDITAPYYICLSFSIELFIKCLHTTTEYKSANNVKLSVHPRSGQHSLSDLLRQLPEDIKSDCEKKYSEKHTRSLAEDMEHIYDVFVKYRYQYEDINTNKQRVLCVSIFEDVGAFFNEYSTNAGNFTQALK